MTVQDDRLYNRLVYATQGKGAFGRFMADPQHYYLGRTCPWKRCGRGIRASCEALQHSA